MKERKHIPVFFPTGSFMKPMQDGIVTDPFGSYTGVTEEVTEVPVQDVDDL